MDPSWHHNYASLAWFGGEAPQRITRIIRRSSPNWSTLTTALHALAHEPGVRARYLARPRRPMPTGSSCTPEQREALVTLDVPAIVAMGAHPLVPFLANMQMQRARAAA